MPVRIRAFIRGARMPDVTETRRRFMTHFASIGLGTTLEPGITWARRQEGAPNKIRLAMVADAMKWSSLEVTDAELKGMVDAANRNHTMYEEMRAIHIPNDVSPPFHFSPIVAGMHVSR